MSHPFSILFPLVLLSISCFGAGSWVLALFPNRPKDKPLAEVVIAFVMGQGILGSFFLFLALMGWFTRPLVLAVLVPIGFFGLWGLAQYALEAPAAIQRSLSAFHKERFIWQLLGFVTIFLLFAGGASFTYMIDGDARAFYLALPKVIAASHRLVPLPQYESFTSVGLLAEMQLAALFLLDMPGASPRLYSWLNGLGVAVLFVAIARITGLGKRGQLLCVVMLLTSSAVAYFWGWGKTDLFAVSFALAAVLFALLDRGTVVSRKSSVALAGFYTGFALVAKLSYLVAFLPTIFVLLFWNDLYSCWREGCTSRMRQELFKNCCVCSLIFFGTMLLSLLPHFLKNYLLLNTLIDTFGSHRYFSEETTRRIVFTFPFWPFFGSFWAQYGNISPLILAFFPALVWMLWKGPRKNTPVLRIIAAAVAGLLAWIVLYPSVPMPRYFLATLLLLIVPVAWAMERISYEDRWLHYLVVLAAFVSIHIFFKRYEHEIFPIAAANNYLFGERSEKSLDIREVNSKNVYEAINMRAEPGARVYLGSFFRFWLRPDLIQCANGKLESAVHFDPLDPEKFWLQIYEHGFTYMFIEPLNPAFAALSKIPDWMHVETIYPQNLYYGGAYRLWYDQPPSVVKFVTKEVSPGAWDVLPVND